MSELAVGRAVRVFDVNGRRVGQPPGGWRGEIVKIGRTLVTITYDGAREDQQFRLDDRKKNDDYKHRRFMLTEEYEQESYRQDVMRGISESLGLSGPWLMNPHLPTPLLEAIEDTILTYNKENDNQ